MRVLKIFLHTTTAEKKYHAFTRPQKNMKGLHEELIPT